MIITTCSQLGAPISAAFPQCQCHNVGWNIFRYQWICGWNLFWFERI